MGSDGGSATTHEFQDFAPRGAGLEVVFVIAWWILNARLGSYPHPILPLLYLVLTKGGVIVAGCNVFVPDGIELHLLTGAQITCQSWEPGQQKFSFEEFSEASGDGREHVGGDDQADGRGGEVECAWSGDLAIGPAPKPRGVDVEQGAVNEAEE